MPAQHVIDTLKIPVNMEVDDIMLVHNSDFDDSKDNAAQMSDFLQNVIDDLVEQNKKKIRLDDE